MNIRITYCKDDEANVIGVEFLDVRPPNGHLVQTAEAVGANLIILDDVVF